MKRTHTHTHVFRWVYVGVRCWGGEGRKWWIAVGGNEWDRRADSARE